MKLVDFETFIRLPSGTIFAPYKPCVMEECLAIKVDKGKEFNGKHYFNGVAPLTPWIDADTSLFEIGDEEKAKFAIYDGDNNDYSEYEMFLILDDEDVDNLVWVLQWAKDGCKGEKQ